MEHKERKAGAKGTIVQFIQFGFVGVLNTLVDFLVFQALNLLAGWTYLAQVVGYSCGVVNSYLWNSNWTFRDSRTHSAREMLLFLIVNLASLGVSLGVMWLDPCVAVRFCEGRYGRKAHCDALRHRREFYREPPVRISRKTGGLRNDACTGFESWTERDRRLSRACGSGSCNGTSRL